MRIPAYAKINLYLDVMERTPDGFHNIKSVMHTVSLCDYVSAEKYDSVGQKIKVACDREGVPTGENNIVFKTAKAFFEYFDIKEYNVSFHIEKHIPMAAGLAGGSTDAGAALVLLNELFDVNAGMNTLMEIGAKIGSDVPFCVLGGTALATGRGEVLMPLSSKLNLRLVIAKGGEGISTPAAYRQIDEKYGDTLCDDFSDISSVLRSVENGDVLSLASGVYNTFESVVLSNHPEARAAKEIMLNNGAICALLSGSGPSVFGVFNDAASAEIVCRQLLSLGYEAEACHSI